MKNLQAHDVMSRDIVTISPKATVIEAAKLMLDNRISGLPVVAEQGQLVGIVSEGDLLHRVEIGTDAAPVGEFFCTEMARQFLKSHGRYVEDVMTTKVASVFANTPLAEIARLLDLMRLKRVPVTELGKIVGIISRADLLRVLIDEVEAPAMSAAL